MSEGGKIPIKGPTITEATDLDLVTILPREQPSRSGVPIPDRSAGMTPKQAWTRLFLEVTGRIR